MQILNPKINDISFSESNYYNVIERNNCRRAELLHLSHHCGFCIFLELK